MSSDSAPLTEVLLGWRQGDRQAADRLLPLLYDELHGLAARYMRQERPDHTLQATALVNELYIRLSASTGIDWQNRAHFFAVAAQQLRRILVNHARDRQAEKRGGKRVRLSLTEVNGLAQPAEEDLLELDEALTRLQQIDSRAAQVVELRFFAGLQENEAAEVLGVSVPTVKRDWQFARAWLIRHMRAPASGARSDDGG
jgi:RNA polymerase sigma factor (TIGR02999 family)